MSRHQIDLPPEVAAVRAALWAGPRDAGAHIVVTGQVSGRCGYIENVVLGSYMAVLDISFPDGMPEEMQTNLTVVDISKDAPPRDDGLGLLFLQITDGTCRLHIELSERLFQWNDVYYRLTGGILAEKSLGEIRDAEAVIVAGAVGQFLTERSG